MRKFLLVTSLIIVILLVIKLLPYMVASFFEYVQVDDNYYHSMEAAEKDGAIKRGWIPPILPVSSNKIYEWHDTSSNEVWIKFKFDNKDLPEFINKMEKLTLPEIKSLNLNGLKNPEWWQFYRRPYWWSRAISQDSIENANEEFPYIVASYEIVVTYVEGHARGYFFLDPKTDEAFYYSNGKIN